MGAVNCPIIINSRYCFAKVLGNVWRERFRQCNKAILDHEKSAKFAQSFILFGQITMVLAVEAFYGFSAIALNKCVYVT
jgi:hypothetical protein